MLAEKERAIVHVNKRIGLFEPWGLGDLAIALSAFREIDADRTKLYVVCDSAWTAWVGSLAWISAAIPICVPWTTKRGKYSLSKYHLRNFMKLRSALISCNLDVFCETRGDIRNELLMKLLHVAPVTTLCRHRFHNRYERSPFLMHRLSLPGGKSAVRSNSGGGGVMCFFGAAWQNRRVPHSISAEVVKRLQSVTGNNVTVILQPDDAVEPWQKLSVCAGGKIVLLQADVCKVAERVVAADVVVSTDSSWLHIAHMYGVPTVGLYGFTNAAEWAPPGCSVVYSDIVFPSKEMHDLSKEAICPLDSLNPDAVVTAALVLLKTSQNC